MTSISFVVSKFAAVSSLQPLRDRRHAVGHFDAELRDRQIALVAPDERDVRAVQRRDDLELRLQDLLGQIRADRVRDRVVNVQDVELLVRRDLRHLRRQRERVGRIRIEQRIRRDRDLVVVNALVQKIQPRGHRVADEVHVVAAPRQRESELRGHDAGAAESGVAGDSDSQTSLPAYAPIGSSIFGGCFERNASP